MVLRTKTDTMHPRFLFVAGEITSHTVWDIRKDGATLKPIIAALKDARIRVSLFSGTDVEQIERTSDIGADRIETLYRPLRDGRNSARGQT